MMKLFNKLDYLLRETFLGLKRGGWMNWAAVSTVTVLLFLFGISLQASWQLEGLLNQFGSQLEISVFLETGVQATSLEPTVQRFPSVTDVQAISKEEAWETLVDEMGLSDIEGATEQLNGNPLVDQLKVKARDADEVAALSEQIGQLPGVDEVLYVTEAVQRIAQLNDGLSWVSLGVISLLSLTAIAVISTTIRLIVMARRREIEVMQLVGATSTWIYLPFLLQGITFGVVGALMAWGLLTGVQEFLKGLLAQQADFIQFLATGLVLTPERAILFPLLLLLLGSSVGLVGSLFAVRRFALR